ncbi:MAG: M1 family metallopeptidase [Bacteroidota bacterium]
MKYLRYICALGLVCLLIHPPVLSQTAIYDSGGELLPEQACYDINFYDLALQIFPDDRSIQGSVEVHAHIVQPTDLIALNLDTLLEIQSITNLLDADNASLDFERGAGYVYVHLKQVFQPGKKLQIAIAYGGRPRVAPMPPWDGGFTWAQTADGSPWIATTCQTIGADVWWPCKDHVSDKPDSMGIHIRVPDPLIVATNGRLINTEPHADGTSTYHWHSSQPISVYNVALNIAPYKSISDTIKSAGGEEYPVIFYVLPEDYEKGQTLFPEIIEHLNFYEKYLGPYPFRADKYGVAQTPHLGMEHQTIIAYGANFDNTSMTRGMDWGFDALHHHELGHEWWGNLVTNSDWRDMWIHEGFCTYMQGLYVEDLEGPKGLKRFMASQSRFPNVRAIAPLASKSSQQIYRAPIYNKGAWVLHSLRYLVGDTVFFDLLRKMSYPSEALEHTTDGSQVRFASTAEFINLAESLSGKELDWFFEVYIRQPKLPILEMERVGSQVTLTWKSPIATPFSMPVEVQVGDKRFPVAMEDGMGSFEAASEAEILIDPDFKFLFASPKGTNLRIRTTD